MKSKITLLTIATLSALSLCAQEKSGDTLKIKWKESRIWIFDDVKPAADTAAAQKNKEEKKDKDFTHWAGIDIGVNTLTTVKNQFSLAQEDDSMQLNMFLDLNYSRSLYFSLNLFQKNIHLYKNYLNLVTGLGFEWNNYNFKQNITLDPDADYVSASNTITSDDIAYKKNKLKISYVKVPVLLEINTNNNDPKKSFHISGGLEFAYKMNSRTKQVYEINGNDFKIKRTDDYHLADLKYSSVLRIGYGDYFTVFGNYALSELFDKNKGPEVYPITAGIAFTF